MLLPLLVPGCGENQRPRSLFARTKQLCRVYARSPAALQLARATLCAPTPRRASQPAAAVAATVPRVAWPPHARNLPCSLARARAVPSARHASQPKTVLPRGCPAWRSGLQTKAGSTPLLAGRGSPLPRGLLLLCARREGSGKLLATPTPGARAPAAASRWPAAAECELAKPICPRRCL